MRMINYLSMGYSWLVVMLVTLAGCAMTLPLADEAGQQPRVLELYEGIAIPEGRTRVFMQNGRIVTGIDEFAPHCALEIRHLSGPPRWVPAGRYPIKRIQAVMTEVVYGVPSGRFAGVSVGIGIHVGSSSIWDDDLSPPEVFEGYHFWLLDTANVGLLRLTCFGARDMPADVEPPTLVELRQVLGGMGRLSP